MASASRAATLTGSFTNVAQNSIVNLTTNGSLDWVHWGLYTATSLNRKAGAPPLITDFIPIAAAGTNSFVSVYEVVDLAHGYSWTDGTPEAVVDDTHTGVWAYGLPSTGTGFEFTVPADSTARVLNVYVGLFDGRGKMEAMLSDGSAAAYTDNSLFAMMASANRIYTFTYAADSDGQTLQIRWRLEQNFRPDGNVTLQAATLSIPGGNNPPTVLLTNPGNNANYALGSSLDVTATANDFDGSITRVEFFADGNKIGEDSSSPYAASWQPSRAGIYSLTAEATDNDGARVSTVPVEVFVFSSGGTLAGAVANPPAQLDLTAEGTADWAHWGLNSATSFNRKSGVAPLLDNFTRIGSQPVMQYSNNFTQYSWSDGTPVSSASDTPTGVFITGQDSGFSLRLSADTTPRRLKLYVGGYGAQANFQAWLSDFSAPAYADDSVSSVFGDSYAVYTLDFAASAANQSLLIQYRTHTLFDSDFGNVTLQAATLNGPPLPVPIQIVNPTMDGDAFSFSFATQAGKNYSAEFVSSLTPAMNWQSFTNVMGNGSIAIVIDVGASAGPRFYRVRQP